MGRAFQAERPSDSTIDAGGRSYCQGAPAQCRRACHRTPASAVPQAIPQRLIADPPLLRPLTKPGQTEPPDSTASVLASITLYLQLATFCPSVPFHGRASASYGTMKRFDGRAFNVGHGPEGKPIILSDDNIAVTLISFDEIRLQHPLSGHPSSVWQHLPSGHVLKPHSAESITFHKLLNTVIPLG